MLHLLFLVLYILFRESNNKIRERGKTLLSQLIFTLNLFNFFGLIEYVKALIRNICLMCHSNRFN